MRMEVTREQVMGYLCSLTIDCGPRPTQVDAKKYSQREHLSVFPKTAIRALGAANWDEVLAIYDAYVASGEGKRMQSRMSVRAALPTAEPIEAEAKVEAEVEAAEIKVAEAETAEVKTAEAEAKAEIEAEPEPKVEPELKVEPPPKRKGLGKGVRYTYEEVLAILNQLWKEFDGKVTQLKVSERARHQPTPAWTTLTKTLGPPSRWAELIAQARAETPEVVETSEIIKAPEAELSEPEPPKAEPPEPTVPEPSSSEPKQETRQVLMELKISVPGMPEPVTLEFAIKT